MSRPSRHETRTPAPPRARSARAQTDGHALYADYSIRVSHHETGPMRRHCGGCSGIAAMRRYRIRLNGCRTQHKCAALREGFVVLRKPYDLAGLRRILSAALGGQEAAAPAH